MEQLLNLVWASVALAALCAFWLQQRTYQESSKVSYLKASVALVTLLIMLFPVISVSDDFHPAMAALDEPAKRLSLVAALLHRAQDGPSTVLLAAMLATRTLRDRVTSSSPELGRISVEKLQADMKDLLPRVASKENDQEAAAAAVAGPGASASTGGAPVAPGGGKTPALDQFTVNLTAKAKSGLDPVVGRDH